MFFYSFQSNREIEEIEPQKEYVQRYQLVPVSESSFNHQIYDQHGTRGRSASDSPEGGNITIPNNGTIYVTSQHPNAAENVNGIRYAAGPDVRFEDEAYAAGARFEYQPGQHHSNPHAGPGEDIKVELIRNQHALHGKVCTILIILSLQYIKCNESTKRLNHDLIANDKLVTINNHKNVLCENRKMI